MVIDPDELMKIIQQIRTDRDDWKLKKRFITFNETDFVNYVKKNMKVLLKKHLDYLRKSQKAI